MLSKASSYTQLGIEEEDFAQTARSIARELIPLFGAFEPARTKPNGNYITHQCRQH